MAADVKREFSSFLGLGNATASVLRFFFPLPFPRFRSFFSEMEMEPCDIPRSSIFRCYRQSFAKTEKRISLFTYVPSHANVEQPLRNRGFLDLVVGTPSLGLIHAVLPSGACSVLGPPTKPLSLPFSIFEPLWVSGFTVCRAPRGTG